MKELKVGDVLYGSQYTSEISSRIVIDRVTPKRAYSGHMEFNREYSEGMSICERGASGYGKTYYNIATDKLDAKWERRCIIGSLRNIKFTEYSTETLKQVYGLLTSTQS